MNLPELKAEIASGDIRRLYVFVGVEGYVMNAYAQKIAQARDQVLSRPHVVDDVYSTLPLRSQQPICYVVSEDKDLPKHEKVWDRLTSQLECGTQSLVLTYSKLDKRSKFYKHFEEAGCLIEFPRLGNETMLKYAAKELGNSVSLELLDALVLACEHDTQRLLLECDKIRILATVDDITVGEATLIAFKQGLVHESLELTLFDLVDLTATGKPKSALKALSKMLESGESPMAILAVMYSSYRDMMVAKVAGKDGDVVARTGLTQWQLNSARKRAFKYNAGTLVSLVRRLRTLEKQVKTGIIQQDMAAQVAVLVCLDGRNR